MKYLYPYECEKEKLSSPGELQAAIDGNRREGRRPSYGNPYGFPEGVPNMHPFGNMPGAGMPPRLGLPGGSKFLSESSIRVSIFSNALLASRVVRAH